MSDYSATPLPKKLGIKEGHRVAVVMPPSDPSLLLAPLPQDVRVLKGIRPPVDVVLFFATKRKVLDDRFPKLADALTPDGGLWIAWPKKASKIDSELTFELVQGCGLDGGLVDNKSCSIDDDWQALRFVYRREDRPGRKAR